MNKRFLILPLLVLAAMTFGCREGEEIAEAVSDVVADVTALRDMSDRFDELSNAGDFEGLVDFNYAEDAVRMPPNEPMRVGKAAILELYKADAEKNDIKADNVPLKAEVSGDLAYVRGIATVSFTPKDGGEVTHGAAHWLAVYERQPDGGWKVICDIWVLDDSVSMDTAGGFEGGVISGSATADAEVDAAAIRKALADWYAAYNAGDYEGIAATYAEHAVSVSEDEPPLLSGRAAIMAAFKQEMEQFDLHNEEGLVQDVRVSGDLGFARGVDTGTASPKDGSDPIDFDTKWVAVYVRKDDGSWLCVCEFGNSNK